MNLESSEPEKRRLTLHCATLNMTVEFSLRPGEFARIGASTEMEITLPLAGLRDEECRLSRDEAGALWLVLPGGGRVRSPGGFDAGPYFFEIAEVATKAAAVPPPIPPVMRQPPAPAPAAAVVTVAEEPPVSQSRVTRRGVIAAAAAAVLIAGLTVWLVLRERTGAGHPDKNVAAAADSVPNTNTAPAAEKPPAPAPPPVPPRPKAGAEFRAKAEAGDALSQALLADALWCDDPDDALLLEAAEWAEKSSAQGCALGTQILATLMKEGDGCTWDPTRAEALEEKNVEALLAGADAGPPAWKRWIFHSPMRRAPRLSAYPGGWEGYAPHDRRRLQYLQAAIDAGDTAAVLARVAPPGLRDDKLVLPPRLRTLAEAGMPAAMHAMGRCSLLGTGVPKDAPAAIVWFEKAAAAGWMRSLLNLAVIYHGEYTKSAEARSTAADIKNPAKCAAALERALAAAQREDSRVATEFFSRLELGYTLPRDSAAAAKWLAKVSPKCQARAIARLIDQLLDPTLKETYDPVRAEAWYEKLMALEPKPPGVFVSLESAAISAGGGTLTKEDPELSIKWHRRAAEGGNVQAMNTLAAGYAEGYRLPKDTNKAREWYLKAAVSGDPRAAWYYASFLKYEKDLAGAERWHRKAAEAGLVYAMNDLAELLAAGGGGVTKNDTEATRWYRKSAEGGYFRGAAILCWRLEKKMSVEEKPGEAAEWRRQMDIALGEAEKKSRIWLLTLMAEAFQKEPHEDKTEARAWWTKAADEGDNRAMHVVSYAPKDAAPELKAQALKFLQKLAEEGDGYAMWVLGGRYLDGDGVTKDKKLGVQWLLKSAEKGETFAFSSLAFCYAGGDGVPVNNAEAVKWFRKAAESGNYESANIIGNFYHAGKGIAKNTKVAQQWYEWGAMKDDATAMLNAGAGWANGDGPRKDMVRALAWTILTLERATEPGKAENVRKATFNRGLIEKRLTRAQIAAAQKLKGELAAKIEADAGERAARIQKGEGPLSPEELDAMPGAKTGTARSDKSTRPRGAAYGVGTAWAISDSGHLLTCAHIVDGAASIKVYLPSGGTVSATVLRADKASDLAVLKIDATTAALPVAGEPEVGQKVATLGFPNTILQGSEVKFTDGIVSSLTGLQGYRGLMQISVPVQPGNSGGPLLDLHGAVVGVVSSRLSDRAAIAESGAVPQAVNYATKIALARPLLLEFASESTAPSGAELALTDLVKRVRPSVFMVEVTLK